MTKRYENKKHSEHIHTFECRLAGPGCDGPIVAHHLMKPWSGIRGMGRKSGDENLIPLCDGHHKALHAHGNELKFFEEIAGREFYGKLCAQHLWLQSPHYEKDIYE
tara:strand:+ start:2263 stop:2580 length:318 start_codon:yes stop_codon:yes gene_type:complete